MLFYIIRHGETNFNIQRIAQGWIDEPLNEKGRLLARLTGQGMKEIHFDRCISSPLSRAKETAEIILKENENSSPNVVSDVEGKPAPCEVAGGLQIETDDRIKEMHFGIYEGTRLEDNLRKRFFDNPFTFGKFPEGEQVLDVCRRTQKFLKELIALDDGKTYLISTHGCAMRAMLNWLYDDPSNFWQDHVPYNCEVAIVEAKNGIAQLIEKEKIYYDPSYLVDHLTIP